jgi:hypothetical protein
MVVCPTCTSLRSMELGRLGAYVHPAVNIRPRSAHARVFGLGAGRAAARGCIIPDDSGSEEERAAGGPGPEPPILSGRGALIGMVAVHGYMVQGYMVQGYVGNVVQGYIQWTSTEPSGGVMTRLRCGRSSDSDGRSLHIAGLGQAAGPRHSTAPNGVRRETPAGRGWTGSKAETRGGPGHRAEPDNDPRCAVGGWSRSVVGHDQCQQTTVTELFRNDSYSPFKERVESEGTRFQVPKR